MQCIQLHLLGPVRVERDGVPVHGFESRKALALLCYLALHNQPQTRSHLAELFWEGKSEERGKGNLSRVLHNLSQVVPGCLNVTRYAIGLARGGVICTDVDSFDILVTRGDNDSLATAVDLYRGDVLIDVQLDDCPEFEQWMEGVREHWRQRQIQLLITLIGHSLHTGSSHTGIPWANRLLQLDPWCEEGYRAMMQLLHATGQRSAALAQYETCRSVLAEELGVDPEKTTVELYERIRDGIKPLPAVSPLMSVPAPRSVVRHCSIPVPITSFVSRDDELALMLGRLRDPACRLLTTVGPGGIGKTRLAMQAVLNLTATDCLETVFADGVIYVPLAAVEAIVWNESTIFRLAADQVLATSIAAALRIAFAGPDTPQTQVLHYLCDKNILLVLDNFEQLLAASDFLVELLEQVAGLKVLTTSQVRLHLQGEQTIELNGLRYPGIHDSTDWMHWEDYSAVKLFQQRASAAHARFAITAETYEHVVRICQLVDGLPLGIELAASWVRLLSCHEIAREIERNLGFLQNPQRNAPQRHRSLHAVFDYTWNGLTPAEQRVLRQLSVFRGGFERDAAVDVAYASLPLLATLVDKSLVHCTNPADHPNMLRYEMMEVIRQYTAEKLGHASAQQEAETEAVRDRYCHYYLRFLRQHTEHLRSRRQAAALNEIHQEIENIRTAWHWATTRDYFINIDEGIASLFHFYDMRSWFQEGKAIFAQTATWLAGFQATNLAARTMWAKALARQGWFTFHCGYQRDAQVLLEQSLQILRPFGASAELVFVLHRLAAVHSYQGAYEEAQRICKEALDMSSAQEDHYSIAIAKTILAQIADMQGEYLDARRLCQEGLVIDRAIGNRWGIAYGLMKLGTVASALQDYQQAWTCFEEVKTIRESLGDARGIALCLNHLGDMALALSNAAEASHLYQSSLKMFKAIGNQWGVADSLTRLGYSALNTNEHAHAAAHFHEALRIALRTQAIPKVLEALVGIALLLLEEKPSQAQSLAALVQQHPSTTKIGIDNATTVLKCLGAHPTCNDVLPSRKAYDVQSVNEIAASLLDNAAQFQPYYVDSAFA